jgi:predicted nucleotidyltransferase
MDSQARLPAGRVETWSVVSGCIRRRARGDQNPPPCAGPAVFLPERDGRRATDLVHYLREYRRQRKEIDVVSVSEHLLDEMVRAIVAEVEPQRIYLFGSCARGTQTADSDVDLLVVEDEKFGPDRNRWSELQRIRKALRPFRVPKDVLVYSRDEFEKWEDSLNHVVAHAVREGKLLYERS